MASVPPCCLQGFAWDGTPTGRETTLAGNPAYVAGDDDGNADADAAVLIVHDLLGWTFPNARLLADHYAREAGVAVYLPDFFGGKVVSFELVLADRWAEVDVPGFLAGSGRQDREPEIFACARELRSKYKKVGAVGFCYGGWACLRLGAKEHVPPLVDCISIGHPSLTTKQDIDEVAVPVQVLAPEIDPAYSDELKLHTFRTLQANGVHFDYQHFPGVTHGCMVRGDEKKPGERAAMQRAKDNAVEWLKQWLA